MPQALYRKYRPKTWGEVIGQDHVTITLQNAIKSNKIAHAYLFAGPRGTGKTTTARILAKAVNCKADDLATRPCNRCEICTAINNSQFLDLIEIDAASNTSVEDIRDLRDKINYSPNRGLYKVYIIDEVHMLSTAAFNALLKTLEEPPDHAIFILATTEIHKIPATVLSRCQRHEFRRIPVVEIVKELEFIAENENIEIDKEALTLIARQSTGAMRDAISLLDQLSSTNQKITLALTQKILGTATNQAVVDLINALIQDNAANGLEIIYQTLDSGTDSVQFSRQIVDYLRNLLLIKMGSKNEIDTTPELLQKMEAHAKSFSVQKLLSVIASFNRAATQAKNTWQPSLPLELAFIESLSSLKSNQPEQETPIASKNSQQAPKTTANAAAQKTAPQPIATAQPQNATESSRPKLSPQDKQATQKLAQTWKTILKLTREKDPKIQAVLLSTTSQYMEGNTLVLCFSSEVVKSMLDKEKNMAIVENAVKKVYQREIKIKCIVDANKRNTIPPEVDSDGMVATAIRDFGGEIVDKK